jgi:hypothetical protein
MMRTDPFACLTVTMLLLLRCYYSCSVSETLASCQGRGATSRSRKERWL